MHLFYQGKTCPLEVLTSFFIDRDSNFINMVNFLMTRGRGGKLIANIQVSSLVKKAFQGM